MKVFVVLKHDHNNPRGENSTPTEVVGIRSTFAEAGELLMELAGDDPDRLDEAAIEIEEHEIPGVTLSP